MQSRIWNFTYGSWFTRLRYLRKYLNLDFYWKNIFVKTDSSRCFLASYEAIFFFLNGFYLPTKQPWVCPTDFFYCTHLSLPPNIKGSPVLLCIDLFTPLTPLTQRHQKTKNCELIANFFPIRIFLYVLFCNSFDCLSLIHFTQSRNMINLQAQCKNARNCDCALGTGN